MRKGSMMGTSKYEFNPEQFDIDVANNAKRHQETKAKIYEEIKRMLESDPVRMDQTFSTMLEVMRELKTRYGL